MTDDYSWDNDPLWFKDAIIYQLHVKAFYDSNNDGIGDFAGLTSRLDYIADLGVNTLWLLPFYPSPLRDDGYDIADYRTIHPDYGSLRDFKRFIREAHRRGIRVITELVINHTSDQHPWFQAARRAPAGSRQREFYVWSDTKQKFEGTRIIFTDTESSNWAWDDEAGAYYWHRFFSHQPDLNFDNPEVMRAIMQVMHQWLDMGVDGMRLDAIPYLVEREGTSNENLPETHQVIKAMRAALDQRYSDRMFLAEANQWPEDVREYFGDGDECHMAYHFPLMPRMYMAVAQGDRHPIVEIMRQTPEIPENCQWAVFLRNHDELTLEMVTDRERDYMYRTYAMDARMRVNIGIRRRLAPLLENDPDKIKLMNSLLLSITGSPIIYYGDEIGMGDNIYLGDRNGVRTPMQWSPDRNAGFSRADPQRLYLPPIMDPIYGYQAVNVEAQARDPSSLLNWMKRLIAVRKAHQAFGRGSLEFLQPGNRKILAYVREYEGESILCVANLANCAQPVELELARFKGRVPVEMMGHTPFPPVGTLPYLLTLPAYGVYWFLLTTEAQVPTWHEERVAPIDLPVLVLSRGWSTLLASSDGRTSRTPHDLLIQEALPTFLRAQRWFAAKGGERIDISLQRATVWPEGAAGWLFAWFQVAVEGQPTGTWFVPLSLIWRDPEELRELFHVTVAKVRRQAQVGILLDAFADERFLHALLQGFREGVSVAFGEGVMRFTTTAAYAQMVAELGPTPTVRRPAGEGSNCALILGDRLFFKAYRRLHEGINPELEIGRFLTEQGFAHIIPVAGAVEYQGPGGPITVGLLQGYVDNQGDAWSFVLHYLDGVLTRALVQPEEAVPLDVAGEPHGAHLHLMALLGQRTGELHAALATLTGDAAFDPEPLGSAEPANLKRKVQQELAATARLLRARLADLGEVEQGLAQAVEGQWPAIEARLAALPDEIDGLFKCRQHGDYHLGQVLVVEHDFVIIDFEGEPARPLAERRGKQSPLRDVAGMLRSFDYAAHAAVARLTIERPGDRAAIEPLAREWARAAGGRFLAAWREAAPATPWEGAAALLELFTLEKVLYEVRYELDHRPDWVAVPLRGLLDLCGE